MSFWTFWDILPWPWYLIAWCIIGAIVLIGAVSVALVMAQIYAMLYLGLEEHEDPDAVAPQRLYELVHRLTRQGLWNLEQIAQFATLADTTAAIADSLKRYELKTSLGGDGTVHVPFHEKIQLPALDIPDPKLQARWEHFCADWRRFSRMAYFLVLLENVEPVKPRPG